MKKDYWRRLKVKDKHIYSLVAYAPKTIDTFTFTFLNDDSKIDHYSTHIYITYSYICISKWSKMEIPKVYIKHYIYILLTLIYVSLNVHFWKKEKI